MRKFLGIAFVAVSLLVTRDISRHGHYAGLGIGGLLVTLILIVQWAMSDFALNRPTHTRRR